MSHDKTSRDSQHSPRAISCIHCKRDIPLAAWGTCHRNHCPHCLWSRHVDELTGDRRSPCRQPMAPVGIEVRAGAEWAIIHRCTGCNTIRTNRIAGDDNEYALLALALRPLANPPFPIDGLTSATTLMD